MNRDWLTPVLTGCLGMAAILGVKLASVDGTSQVAVVLPPWQSEGEALRVLAETGATIVRPGGLASIWVMHAEPGSKARIALQDVALVMLNPGMLGVCAAARDWAEES